MMDSGIPPTNPNQPNPPAPDNPPGSGGNSSGSESPFAKLFPGASPQEINQITKNFINYTINQMKQDQANMLAALKKMQDDQDD